RRTALLFLAVGMSLYVPMALLPDHVFEFYGWMGVPIGYVPMLLVDRSRLLSLAAGRERLARVATAGVEVVAAALLAVHLAAYAPDGTLVDVISRDQFDDMVRLTLPPGARPSDVESLVLGGRGTATRYAAATRRHSVLPCAHGMECVVAPPTVSLHAATEGL